ncbi:MAG TPA: N,N-dimethylformamidase beta subunit family domain-containing protein [Geminicoccus sp.]|jgi:N,N-dimethylformamidase|uniref:N,N-dimethylformamidase beta subunit family domain-containing protein n=1 Tax=Geminicoccus sp. TaxID=2024832 RepID=UPI002E381D8C|nr:N,N-dimethylformamidase beta subunit family domain-containing protein [Geminicoccus sp.]HEX2527763.1 N,N-dimethylformamidase beta subunit family domain-containing protein [Geminicoccus sp.]
MLKIVGYPDRYSVAPGETISFKISVEEGDSFDARIVQVINGDSNPDGPGLQLPHVPTHVDGTYPGRTQRIDPGSFMRVPGMPALAGRAFTFFATIWPTLTNRGDQTLAAQWDEDGQSGFRIELVDGGKLAFIAGDGSGTAMVSTGKPMLVRQWYQVAASFDPASRKVTLVQKPLRAYPMIDDADQVEATIDVAPTALDAPFLLAASPEPDGTIGRHYDGKIDSPALVAGVHGLSRYEPLLRSGVPFVNEIDLIARWDFSKEIHSVRTVDVGPSRLHGELVHLPTRGMKGWNWTGEQHDWTRKPEHYGAIHFHRDDIYDAGWETSVAFTLPGDFKSGAYALHVRCGDSNEEATREDYLAFFVRPPRGPNRGERPKVAFLAPTCAYIAYANHGEHITARGAEALMNRLLPFGHSDMYMYYHPELGGSLYDSHADGSGVCYSSRHRPVLNFTSRYHSWLGGHGSALYQYNADTHLFCWLHQKGVEYDIITDEDLHHDGYELIKDYRVILTGTHPEYHSTPAWDAMKAWVDRGGRLMYMGGNGWYWRVGFHDELDGAIELRRAEDGIRPWIAEPGEYFQSFNGEYGGLWRRIGRAPNVMAGIGFVAQGFDISSYYRRAPDADNPRAAFIFKDVPDEIIGDFGLIGGGAAGIELDCINTDLGSPPNMLRLASSEGHSSMMMLVNEEFGVVPPALGGDQNDQVRADMAFGETAAGGAIFATGSIAWCGALLPNNSDNNVSRITWNVLERFMDPKPFTAGS